MEANNQSSWIFNKNHQASSHKLFPKIKYRKSHHFKISHDINISMILRIKISIQNPISIIKIYNICMHNISRENRYSKVILHARLFRKQSPLTNFDQSVRLAWSSPLEDSPRAPNLQHFTMYLIYGQPKITRNLNAPNKR